jgi:hypothetical protein
MLVAQLKLTDKTMMDMRARTKQTMQEIRDDLETKSKRVDVDCIQAALFESIATTNRDIAALQKKLTSKLNEFVDHFGKLHETADDLEHCLKHHAEEIENRSTKYDVLLCQNQIDKLCSKEEFVREVSDLRSVTLWQTSKIEAFGLAAEAGAASNKGSRRTSRKRWQKATTASAFASKGRGGGNAMTASMESMESTMTNSVEVLPSVMQSSTGTLDTALPLTDASASEDDYGSDSDSGGTSHLKLMRQQLEAVSMGLVGLGHLVVREPCLGESRNVALKQEKEVLAELMSLRHWISNQKAPPGWDTTKLVTFALSRAYPKEDAASTRVPQFSLRSALGTTLEAPAATVSLENILSANFRGDLSTASSTVKLQRCTFSADSAKTARPASKGASERKPAKLPLTARAGGTDYSKTLPPLQVATGPAI